MRVLYIITQGEHGGGQKNVFDLSFGMHQKGHEVYVAVGNIEHEGDKWLHKQLENKKIPVKNLLEIKKLQREVNLKKDITSVKEILEIYKKVKPDIVHLHSSKAGVVGGVASFINNYFSKNKKVKTFYTVHGFVFLEPMNKIKKMIFVFLEFVSSLLRDFTIFISEKDLSSAKKLLIARNSKTKKYKIIQNGISEKLKYEMLDMEQSRKYIIEKIPPVPYGKLSAPIIGTISNLYKTKGLEYLIDAAKIVIEGDESKGVTAVPNSIFVVFGTGEEKYKQELSERIRKNNLENNFFLLGKTPDAYKYLKGLNLFTLTSVKEGLPYCLLEARLAGIPIVASSVGGIPDMAKEMEINLVEAKNIEQIAKSIVENINKKTSDNLPKIYTLENMISETEKVYSRISQ